MSKEEDHQELGALLHMDGAEILRLLQELSDVSRDSVLTLDKAMDPAGEVAKAVAHGGLAKTKKRGWFGRTAAVDNPPSSPAELALRQLPHGVRHALAGCVAWALRSSPPKEVADEGLPLSCWPFGPLMHNGDRSEQQRWAVGFFRRVVGQLGLEDDSERAFLPIITGTTSVDEDKVESDSGKRPSAGCRFVIPLGHIVEATALSPELRSRLSSMSTAEQIGRASCRERV